MTPESRGTFPAVVRHGVTTKKKKSRDAVLLALGFPGGTSGKEAACQCRRCKKWEFDPWVGKTPGVGSVIPPQYSCLEDPMGRESWQVIIYVAVKNWTQLSDWAHIHSLKMEEGETNQEVWEVSRSWRKRILLWSLQKCSSPANTLLLAQV